MLRCLDHESVTVPLDATAAVNTLLWTNETANPCGTSPALPVTAYTIAIAMVALVALSSQIAVTTPTPVVAAYEQVEIA